MTLALLYEPEARQEADEAHDRYERERVGLGARFDSALLAAEVFAASTPQAGSPLAKGRRRVLLEDFPFALVYRVDDDRGAVIVLSVAHFKRRPEFWRARGGGK